MEYVRQRNSGVLAPIKHNWEEHGQSHQFWPQKMTEPHRPGVTSQVEVIVPEVGHVSDSLRRCLKVASSFSLAEHLEVGILCFNAQTMN